MIQYAAAIVLGAFLLFLVQPVLARYILPWYGGGPMVWTTCMLFFQVFLLGGYLYAHLISTYLRARTQAIVHTALLAVSFTFLPITPSSTLKPADPLNPVEGILVLLVLSVGLPFLLVSSTSPLLQKWLKLAQPQRSPYRLFALSNFGSLLGLLSYPFAIEPYFPLGEQTHAWSIAFGLYAALSAWCAITLFGKRISLPQTPVDTGAIPMGTKVLWLALSTCGSVMLLATTNHLSADVAVVPFLWVLPLSLYLLSFMIAFQNDSWYHQRLWMHVLVVALIGVLFLLTLAETTDFRIQVVVYSAMLLAACMVCHGELARTRPPAAKLTSFYLLVAAGGAAGGVFVTLLAPRFFDGHWEYPLALVASYVLAAWCRNRGKSPAGRTASENAKKQSQLWTAGACALVSILGWHIYATQANTLAMTRNFYGVLKVYDIHKDTPQWRRYFWHGEITHGSQFMDPSRRRSPTQYFGTQAGIGLALRHHPRRQTGLHIGVAGLGAGTIAAYSTSNDSFRYYEINPDVERLSKEYFYYLDDSPAQAEVVLGDARISMEQELHRQGSQQYDVLVIDAFSGDAIPVHLLTREAFELYLKHLRADGILAVHISSLYFDLKPLLQGLARELQWPAVLIDNPYDFDNEVFSAEWVLLTKNEEFLAVDEVAQSITPWPAEEPDGSGNVVWTDDYSNLFQLLLD